MTPTSINTSRFLARLPISALEYLAWFLASEEGGQRQFRTLKRGATKQGLGLEDIRSIDVPVPPKKEQERIVAKIEELFSDLDAGVAALKRARANLKRYRAAVLKAAVEGQLTEQWRAEHPATEPAPKLLDRILAARRKKWEADQLARFATAGKAPPKNWRERYVEPACLDNSQLSALPDGWCWANVEQLTQRSEYGTSVKCDYEAAGPPVLRIPNIAKGSIDLSDLKYSTERCEIQPQDALQMGDLLMCRTNGSISLIGKAALVSHTYRPLHTFASYLLRFRFGESDWLPRWILTYVSSHHGRRFIEGHAASSAGQHNISLSLIHSMPIPLPPLAEQREAVSLADKRLSAAMKAEAEIEVNLHRAARLRQGILKRAFEGRLVPQDPRRAGVGVAGADTATWAKGILRRRVTGTPMHWKYRTTDLAFYRGICHYTNVLALFRKGCRPCEFATRYTISSGS